MFSIKLIESCLEDLKRITRADFYLCDLLGELLVNTFEQFSLDKSIIMDFSSSSAESQNLKGFYFQKIRSDNGDELILVVYAGGNDGYMLSRIAASEVQHMLGVGSESIDKNEFFHDLLMDNILPGEIEKRAHKLKIRDNISRVVYSILIDDELTEVAVELLNNIFSDNKDDIVLQIGEGRIVVIKSVIANRNEMNILEGIEGQDDYSDSVLEFANLILSMINTELMVRTRVTYGRVTDKLTRLSEIYKEATMASEVVSIFYEEKDVASYTSLGIGRLIHQLPEGLCSLFLNEVLGENADKITADELNIIDNFFDNNLNVAETARLINMNRTTLIYKLDKLKRKTGLDIRKFEDALTLKIAMMVAKYLKYLKKI